MPSFLIPPPFSSSPDNRGRFHDEEERIPAAGGFSTADQKDEGAKTSGRRYERTSSSWQQVFGRPVGDVSHLLVALCQESDKARHNPSQAS